ncbi:MAG: hypothetical protein LUC92_09730 [Clostridiales bacterium]|nr:hypothetical protein [Clostridiales bacterium]
MGFTKTIEESTWKLLDEEEVTDYLEDNNKFRPFSKGLDELLLKCDYSGDINNITEKTNYLFNKITALPYKISKKTIEDWFSDERRPNLSEKSRQNMFILCFALELNIEQLQWFFKNVYFDHSFNCRDKEEAVYYYCFNNKLPYSKAVELDNIVQGFPVIQDDSDERIATKAIYDRIENIHNDKEFIEYIKNNNSCFLQNSQSAYNVIQGLLDNIKGKKEDKKVFNSVKAKGRVSSSDMDKIEKCGLVVQDYIKDKDNFNFEKFKGKDISSVDFMLAVIFDLDVLNLNEGSVYSFAKDSKLSDIARRNFPGKKIFSDIISKKKSASFDGMRKIVILLRSYEFFYENCDTDLGSDYYDIYEASVNDYLQKAGFMLLYAGNPYDWIFIFSAKQEDPLKTFREIISNAADAEE